MPIGDRWLRLPRHYSRGLSRNLPPRALEVAKPSARAVKFEDFATAKGDDQGGHALGRPSSMPSLDQPSPPKAV